MANKIENKIEKMLKSDSFDIDELNEYVEEHEDDYNEDGNEYELAEFTFRAAIRLGNVEYVEEHADDFDLNDNGDSSSYLYETEDEGMQQLLMDHGAFRSWEDYTDCQFAVETINGSILAFQPEFQKEVYEKFKEENDLSDEDVIRILSEESDDYDEDELKTSLEWIGVFVEDEEIAFRDIVGDEDYDLKDLLEELGWDCDFEGDMWKLETNGVYFIK